MPENGKRPLDVNAPRERAVDPFQGFTVWWHRPGGFSRKRGAKLMYEKDIGSIPGSGRQKKKSFC